MSSISLTQCLSIMSKKWLFKSQCICHAPIDDVAKLSKFQFHDNWGFLLCHTLLMLFWSWWGAFTFSSNIFMPLLPLVIPCHCYLLPNTQIQICSCYCCTCFQLHFFSESTSEVLSTFQRLQDDKQKSEQQKIDR